MAYATEADYETYSGRAPLSQVPRWLDRASDLVDEVLIGAVYDVDASENPTDPAVIAAFRNAVCAQVEWWATDGSDDADIGRTDEYSSVGIGSVSLVRHNSATSGRKPSRLCARAWGYLRAVGLSPIAVATGYPNPGERGFNL